MSNIVSIDLKDVLEEADIAIFGNNLFIGKMPSEPINCICVYDVFAGLQESSVNIDINNVMIKSRNITYIDGYNILLEIKNFLQSKTPLTVNDTPYIGFWLTSSIGFNGYNELNHAIWSINFRIMRHPNDNVNR